MMSAALKYWGNLVGRGEAAVTVPALDGAFRPNRKLDEAQDRADLPDVDCLALDGETLIASAGSGLYRRTADRVWTFLQQYDSPIAALCSLSGHGYAVALRNGEIHLSGGGVLSTGQDLTCITALCHGVGRLFITSGSAGYDAENWQSDLLERGSSGSVWQVDLETGKRGCIASGLAFPSGIVADGQDLVISEAWKHRLIRLNAEAPGKPDVLYADMPGYPGRITAAEDGYWLSIFAPRSQLVEFVLREPQYRRRMMAEVPQPYWIAPKLTSGNSFYEPLQGGGVKHLGLLKPWAPTLSAGLCVKLDADFQPVTSLHSRADGHTHGVTSIIEARGEITVAARGNGTLVSIPRKELGDGQ
ncbi:hypothetical protein [Roseibium sp.]|uniref:hypothetical protein n=1 Tax=Roseibium sp. TaxID=1936156 RepID=UPI003A9873BA